MQTEDRPVSLPKAGVTWGVHLKSSPLSVAAIALLGYLFITLIFYKQSGDLRDFALIGKEFITQSDRSPIIKVDPSYNYLEVVNGYDGQFAYFIALDPENARYYVDRTRISYRYTRILYPMAARILALGNPDWIPFTLVLVNLLAVALGTWAVAAWCRLKSLSPWLGLIYAFYIGQVTAFTRDLNEVLAYALVALAIYLISKRPRQLVLAGITFGLAGLGRETTLIFPALYTLSFLFGRGMEGGKGAYSKGSVALFALIASFPAIVWQGFLLVWLGEPGLDPGRGTATSSISEPVQALPPPARHATGSASCPRASPGLPVGGGAPHLAGGWRKVAGGGVGAGVALSPIRSVAAPRQSV